MLKIKMAGPFSGITMSKPVIMLGFLGFLVVAQSVAVIYTKQTKRIVHAKIQASYAQRDKLQVEWSQLLLEQGTWQSEARVERIAREQLGMVIPDKINVITP